MNEKIEFRNQRQIKILQLLMKSEDYLTCDDIVSELKLSIRTIKAEIKILKNTLEPYKIFLKSIQGNGYRLILSTRQKKILFQSFSSNYFMYHFNDIDKNQRHDSIVVLCILKNKRIYIKELSDKFYISHTTVANDLLEIKEHLINFNLELNYVPYNGLSIEGKEVSKRMFLEQMVLKYGIEFISQIIEIPVNNYITKLNLESFVNSRGESKISDIELSNLYAHLQVMIIRIYSFNYINENDLIFNEFVTDLEINQIHIYLQQYLQHIKLPKFETIYFILLMKGCNLSFTDDDSNTLSEICLNVLSNNLKIDLYNQDIKNKLSSYLYSLKIRLKNNFNQNVTIIDDINQYAPLSVEIAYRLSEILELKLGTSIPTNEIFYLAYFFLDLRDAQRKYYISRVILIVSSRGTNLSCYLKKELLSNFSFNNFEVCEFYDLDEIDLDKYSLILTDEPIYVKVKCKVLVINFFLKSEDFKAIRDSIREISMHVYQEFLHSKIEIDNNDKLSILKEISYSKTHYDHLIKREQKISFELNDYVIIFTFKLNHPTLIYRLKQKTKWNKNMISYILVLNVCEKKPILDYHDFLKKTNIIV